MVKIIPIMYGSELRITRDLYGIYKDGSLIVASQSILTVFEFFSEYIVRSKWVKRTQDDESLFGYITALQSYRMHFLGRINEILLNIPAECKNQFSDEINMEVETNVKKMAQERKERENMSGWTSNEQNETSVQKD